MDKDSNGTRHVKAPPSTAYRIVDLANPYSELIKSRGVHGTFVGSDESVNPWVPWGDNCLVRYLRFDVRQNTTAVILHIPKPGVIGTHHHRGWVIMVCLEGSMRYLEYDWVAHPGDYIGEAPGESHTLVTDCPQGVKLFGLLQGSIELYDDKAQLIETADVWYWMGQYESYCKSRGIAINPQLYA